MGLWQRHFGGDPTALGRSITINGVIFSIIQVFPTGDLHGRYMAKHQPATTAAMEGLWKTERGAGLTIMGQPDVEKQRIDNPLVVNKMLSFLIYGPALPKSKV